MRTLIIIIINTVIFNLYLYELFYGNMNAADIKAMFYVCTSITLLYLTVDEMVGYNGRYGKHLNLIGKLSLATTFFIFYSVLQNFLPHPKLYLFLFNGLIFAISFMILFFGLRYGYFKSTNENE